MPRHSRPDPKSQELRAQGVLNPHPERVREPLFQEHDFFDPRDLVQVKYEMLRCAHLDGRPAAGAASAFGFSRPSFYKAEADFEREGMAGLLSRRPGPKGAHKLTPEVLAFVRKLAEAEEGLRATALAQRVAGRFGVQVHPRSIERALRRREKKRT